MKTRNLVGSIKQKIKRVLPVVLIMSFSVALPSCDGDDNTMSNLPSNVVELTISYPNYENVAIEDEIYNYYYLSPVLKEQVAREEIDIVYIVPVDFSKVILPLYLKVLREQILGPALEYSPKVRAKGDFNFEPGTASSKEPDSLWLTQQLWTINKRLFQEQ